MRLLVSVRSADESAVAVAAGADIVDAKEPARGSLGPVTAPVLRGIAAAVPAGLPLSAALGDFQDCRRAAVAVARVPVVAGGAPLYLKLGFRGVGSETTLAAIVSAATATAGARGDGALVVAAAYADYLQAETLAPEAVLRVAAAAGGRT